MWLSWCMCGRAEKQMYDVTVCVCMHVLVHSCSYHVFFTWQLVFKLLLFWILSIITFIIWFFVTKREWRKKEKSNKELRRKAFWAQTCIFKHANNADYIILMKDKLSFINLVQKLSNLGRAYSITYAKGQKKVVGEKLKTLSSIITNELAIRSYKIMSNSRHFLYNF